CGLPPEAWSWAVVDLRCTPRGGTHMKPAPGARQIPRLLRGLLLGALLLALLAVPGPALAQQPPGGAAGSAVSEDLLRASPPARLRQVTGLRRAGDRAYARGDLYGAIESYNQ